MVKKNKDFSNKFLLTKKGLESLKEEYSDKVNIQRRHINDDINRARLEGDISENGAYSAAMLERELNEARISEIEDILKNYVIATDRGDDNIVQIGSKVVVSSEKGQKTLMMVGVSESNPIEGKISVDSPIGAALVKKRKGDSVKVSVGDDIVEYNILSIEN